MEHCVFIHTNHKQIIGAKVAAYALKRNSDHNDKFSVQIIHTDDYEWTKSQDGKNYLRDGVQRVWLYDDLQSFTPLRFLPPELMNYQGRSLVIDPDIFAISDIWELLNRDMEGKAILCRKKRAGKKNATSVMLLDNSQLKHWKAEETFQSLFMSKLDYQDWITLKTENPDTIGCLESEWNDFDRLTEGTKMLHNTKRMTQPWKTGLPVDWRLAERILFFRWTMILKRKLFGEYAFLGNYRKHPDPNQEQLFFGLLKECLEQGVITQKELDEEMAANHVRHDAPELLGKTDRLEAWPAFPIKAIAKV